MFPLDLSPSSLRRSEFYDGDKWVKRRGIEMYCVHCGAEGAVLFCAKCGKRQLSAGDRPASSGADDASLIVEAVLVDDDKAWVDSLDYEFVLRQDSVRRRLAAAGRDAPAGLNSDDLLSIFDAVSPIGISLGKLNEALLPIYEKMGIKVQRTALVQFAAPAGRVLAATLAAMAGMSLEIIEVRQQPDACACIARIPSGLITYKGELIISIQRHDYVDVRVGSKIAGQLYDWGRSTRLIDNLITEIGRDLVDQWPGHSMPYRRVA